eukprot:17299_1
MDRHQAILSSFFGQAHVPEKVTRSMVLYVSMEKKKGNNQMLFIADKQARKEAVEFVLSMWSKPCQYEFYSSNPQFIWNSLQYEFIVIHQNKLSVTLSLITKQMNEIGNTVELRSLCENFLDLLQIIYHEHNGLVIKHCFHSRQIWNNLLIAILNILLLAIKVTDKRSIQWSHYYLILFRTMKWLKRKHFMFAVNKGLNELLTMLYIINAHFKGNTIKSISLSFLLYEQCLETAQNIGIEHYFIESLQKRFERHGIKQLYLGYLHHVKQFSMDGMKMNNFDFDFKCGWPLCNKKKHEFQNKNKCKGCKLTQYCSRNHQKKHWNHIHREQCLRIISESTVYK